MREISLHILDLAQNSIEAGATFININIDENEKSDKLTFTIEDNGKGMSPEEVSNAYDPFRTTRKTRRVGLGIPLAKLACEMSGGSFSLKSRQGKGTSVKAVFGYSSIDRRPLGNIAQTVHQLITANDKIDFMYTHTVNGKRFAVDTRKIKRVLNGISVNETEISSWISDFLRDGESRLR